MYTSSQCITTTIIKVIISEKWKKVRNIILTFTFETLSKRKGTTVST